MQEINNIGQLREQLEGLDADDIPDLLKRLNLKEMDCGGHSTWSEGTYTRNCLYRSDEMEVVLMCWDPKVYTPIHDHAGSNCWVYGLGGELTEDRYDYDQEKMTLSKSTKVHNGETCFINDEMGYHAMANKSGEKTMTIHFYASPISSCQVYDDEEGSFLRRELSYHSMA